MKNILYTVALDINEYLILASLAEKGNEYRCPVCKGNLILRKSGKTGKGSKRPHFAHINLSHNCTPESALHFSYKNLLFNKLEHHLLSKTPLPFSWKCNYCLETHSGELLKKITSVKLEHNINVCIPDIALLDNNNNVFAVVEVVVTHKPEDNVLKFYQDNNIVMIQIILSSDKDIDDLDNKISNPDLVQFCFNPKCKKCGHYLHKTIMTIGEGNCWRCNSKMKFAAVEGGEERESSCVSPEKFTKYELDQAISKGVLIKEHYSKTSNDKYLANTCSNCNAFIGEFFLFSEYLAPALLGHFPSESFPVGYHCDNCYIIENNLYENN